MADGILSNINWLTIIQNHRNRNFGKAQIFAISESQTFTTQESSKCQILTRNPNPECLGTIFA
jgi:hypothetical protein